MGKVGRPSQFRNAAEKQKAYRERQKAIKALLNSSCSVIQSSEPVSELDRLVAEEKRLGERADKHNFMPFWSEEFLAMGYGTWKKLSHQYQEEWSIAHSQWYAAWKAVGFPKRLGDKEIRS